MAITFVNGDLGKLHYSARTFVSNGSTDPDFAIATKSL